MHPNVAQQLIQVAEIKQDFTIHSFKGQFMFQFLFYNFTQNVSCFCVQYHIIRKLELHADGFGNSYSKSHISKFIMLRERKRIE